MSDLTPLTELAELGLSAEQYAGVLRVISVMVRDAEVTATVTIERNADDRTTNKSAERQRRYRERVKSGAHNASDVTRYDKGATEQSREPSPALPPSPKKENNPLPPLTPPPDSSTARGTRLPADWVLPTEWSDWCREQWPNIPDSFVKTQSEQFSDYWRSLPGAKARKADWLAAWRNWMRRSVEMRRQQQTRAGPPPGRMTQADAGRIATEFFRKQAEEGEDDEQSGTGEGERGDRSDAPHVLGRPL